MSNSYKFYSDTKDIMKKYVNATEGAIIYGISKSRIMVLASEAGRRALVGTVEKRDKHNASSGSAGAKPVRNPEREKPKWEDTITNRMLHWSYTPEQKEEVKKALAAGVPKATILTYFYPEVTVEKMSSYRKKQ